MSDRLSGKVIVITGGASGIGFATAEACAREGAKLALIDLDGAAAEASAAKLKDSKGYAGDVTDEAAIGAAFEAILKDF